MELPVELITAVKTITGTVITKKNHSGANYIRRSARGAGTELVHDVQITDIKVTGNGMTGTCVLNGISTTVYKMAEHRYWNTRKPNQFTGIAPTSESTVWLVIVPSGNKFGEGPLTKVLHGIEVFDIHDLGNGKAGVCYIDGTRTKIYKLDEHKFWNTKMPRSFLTDCRTEPTVTVFVKKSKSRIGDAVEVQPHDNASRPVSSFFDTYKKDRNLTFPMK